MTAVHDKMRVCSQKKKVHPASVDENRINDYKTLIPGNDIVLNPLTLIMILD